LEEIEASNYQLGTLGGGNHFIELQKTQANSLGIMIHSGSRNLGNIIARRYITKAQESMRQYYSKVPEDLAFLDLNSHAGREYYDCMRYCGLYAKKNRLYLLHIVDSVLDEVLKTNIKDKSMGFVDCTHNYAELYTIKSTLKGMVHRKGAISARKNELGIIPGSQGSTSYIVEGKGNKQSFQSCSHGAGRVLSRNEAKDKLNLNEQKALLDGQGIIHSMNNISDLDEAPGAYKSITEVLKSQEDLVEIILTLNPILNIKG
jgi:tRNA-splicing ligase RtcB